MAVKMQKYMVGLAMILALFVVALGAYTRLADAGLGCPDWPGCYGRIILPKAKDQLDRLQLNYPQIPIETHKAWTEMAHRYAAGTLGLLIFLLLLSVFFVRMRSNPLPLKPAVFLMILVIFQAVLGMWTVTLKLLPVVVMGHLLGGMMIFAGLYRYRLQLMTLKAQNDLSRWHKWIAGAFVLVFIQIALGGWVSANYAGMACIGFPRCNGVWWPEMTFSQGFHLFSPVGLNYQGGLLANNARASIQIIHRIGAVLTFIYIMGLSLCLLAKVRFTALRITAWAALVLIMIQFSLGIMNVLLLLPLPIAVAHNTVAALLLATVFSMFHWIKKENRIYAGRFKA